MDVFGAVEVVKGNSHCAKEEAKRGSGGSISEYLNQ